MHNFDGHKVKLLHNYKFLKVCAQYSYDSKNQHNLIAHKNSE